MATPARKQASPREAALEVELDPEMFTVRVGRATLPERFKIRVGHKDWPATVEISVVTDEERGPVPVGLTAVGPPELPPTSFREALEWLTAAGPLSHWLSEGSARAADHMVTNELRERLISEDPQLSDVLARAEAGDRDALSTWSARYQQELPQFWAESNAGQRRRAAREAGKPRRRRLITRAHLVEVADAYLADPERHDPTVAVVDHWRASRREEVGHRTAVRWVAMARAEGLLPATVPGRASRPDEAS